MKIVFLAKVFCLPLNENFSGYFDSSTYLFKSTYLSLSLSRVGGRKKEERKRGERSGEMSWKSAFLPNRGKDEKYLKSFNEMAHWAVVSVHRQIFHSSLSLFTSLRYSVSPCLVQDSLSTVPCPLPENWPWLNRKRSLSLSVNWFLFHPKSYVWNLCNECNLSLSPSRWRRDTSPVSMDSSLLLREGEFLVLSPLAWSDDILSLSASFKNWLKSWRKKEERMMSFVPTLWLDTLKVFKNLMTWRYLDSCLSSPFVGSLTVVSVLVSLFW